MTKKNKRYYIIKKERQYGFLIISTLSLFFFLSCFSLLSSDVAKGDITVDAFTAGVFSILTMVYLGLFLLDYKEVRKEIKVIEE